MRQILGPDQGRLMSNFMRGSLDKLQKLPLITLSLIQGKAIGGGAELITACDYRLATQDARIGFVHRKMGITTGWSGGTRLVGLIGRRNALELLLTCDQLSADQAVEIGLVDHILDENVNEKILLDQAKEYLAMRTCGSVRTLRAIKRMVDKACELNEQKSLDAELEFLVDVWGKEAHQSALNANLKHRS